MAVAATLLTSGNDTTDLDTYTTGTFTPSSASDALILFAFLHRVATGPITLEVVPVLSGGGVATPVALAVVDGVWDAGGAAAPLSALMLEVWAIKAAAGTAGQSILTQNVTVQTAVAWAVVQVTGVVPVTIPLGSGAIGIPIVQGQSSLRRVAIGQSTGRANDTSGRIQLGSLRSTSNGVLAFWAHNKNEGKTPNAAYVELCDERNADLVSLQAQWAAPPGDLTPSASWATGTPYWSGIAIEIAAPSNTMFATNPDEKLYVGA